MSTHPNNNNRLVTILVVVVGGIIAWQYLATEARHRTGRPPEPVVRVSRTLPAPPQQNPIARMLENRSSVSRQSGTAVAVLVDVSGSMRESVSSAFGQVQPKIEIARASVLRLFGQVDRFAREHPDRPVVVGVYEFSARARQPSCRCVVPIGPPDLTRMRSAVGQMVAEGDTPIGDALIYAKQELNATGMASQHILVVTDGENNRGYAPADVVDVISRLPEAERASVYCIAFDIAADRFRAVRDAGGLVLGAMNEGELQQTMDYVLTGKILAEQPEAPKVQ
jgi:Mg-chelatase subunit ChlD